MVTRGGRGREGRSQACQGWLRGNQNRQFSLLCRLQPSQELPGKSRGVQSWWLNHRWRARLVTGAHLLLQPGRPGRDPDRCFQHTRLPRGRRQLDLLFFLQLRSSLQLPCRFPLSRWPRKGRHHRCCLPRLQRAPVSPPSPRRWETARSRIRGRFRDYISPPVDNIADLPREPATHLWQVLPDEMGKVNIGLAGKSKLVITTSQGELFRQVVIDKAVDNTTGHALLKSLLGDGYRVLLPCIVKLRDKYTWLQICDSSQ